ncbi:MAG: hypothetical protein ACOYM0_01465 [Bacteroidales bacterium]
MVFVDFCSDVDGCSIFLFVTAISIPSKTKTPEKLQLPFIRLFERTTDKRYKLNPEKIEGIFGEFIPVAAMDMLIVCLQGHSLDCRIARKRATKTGDFRPAGKGHPPRITVNGDMNPYAFLLTLIHEVAHFFVYLDTEKSNTFLMRKHRPKPHGKEWKKRFTGLMQPFISMNIFPPEIENALVSYFENPKASSSADSLLQRMLQAHDPPGEHVRITDVAEGELFKTGSGRIFEKMDRLRKRYRCMCVKSRRMYLFSPEAMILPMKRKSEEKVL